jgi:hypothetical protein
VSIVVTTISSATQVYSPPPTSHAHSGKGRMADAIAQQQQTGALSSTDATALTSALDAIDSGLQDSSSTTGTASGSGSTQSARLDPSDMQDRIDSLISDQVDSGALTSDQANELSNLFASHGTSVTDSTAGGLDGPPPGPPPADGGASPDGTDATSATPGTTSANDLLSTFIQQLQAAQSSKAGYGASGTTASQSSSALLFDFKS